MGNALWQCVKPDRADIKNGEIALKLRKSYTYASKYALILQIMGPSKVLQKKYTQNMARRKTLKSKCEAFSDFYVKIWQVSNICPQNLTFVLFFMFWLNDDIFCQRWYQFILKRRIKKLGFL